MSNVYQVIYGVFAWDGYECKTLIGVFDSESGAEGLAAEHHASDQREHEERESNGGRKFRLASFVTVEPLVMNHAIEDSLVESTSTP